MTGRKDDKREELTDAPFILEEAIRAIASETENGFTDLGLDEEKVTILNKLFEEFIP